MIDDAKESPTPIPVKLGRVNSPRQLKRALVRMAEAVLEGRIAPRVGGTVMYGLAAVGKILELEVLDRRLKALEERADSLPAQHYARRSSWAVLS